MSYQVLARKYRPQNFSEVIGQDHVTQTLRNAIEQKRVAHGYIFSGHRGIGKTTVARLVAMALNCHSSEGPVAEPCGKCASCTEIRAGNSLDVIEIDAASNRGIDEIRELRDATRYRPARDRYKVYILDEAHQITDAAFNALLKTLEEPPSHVVFLMATTQAGDIPQTIRSRCQHFSFHAVRFSDILSQLKSVAARENIQADEDALALLAEAGDGSMRDALSILDQAIACCGTTLTSEQIRGLVGSVPTTVLEEILMAVGEDSSARVLQRLNALLSQGHNPVHFARQMVRFLRNTLVAKVAGGDSPLLEISSDERARVQRVAAEFSEEDLTRFLNIILRTYDELGYKQEPRLHLELGILKMLHARHLMPLEQLLSRLQEPGAGIRPPLKPASNAALPTQANQSGERTSASRGSKDGIIGATEARGREPGPGTSPFESDRLRKKGGQQTDIPSTYKPFADSRLQATHARLDEPSGFPASVNSLTAIEAKLPPPSSVTEESGNRASMADALKEPPEVMKLEEKATEADSAASGGALPVERIKLAVVTALEQADQRAAASLFESGEWSAGEGQVEVKVNATSRVLAIAYASPIKYIAENAARNAAALPLSLKVTGTESANGSTAGKGTASDKPRTGNLEGGEVPIRTRVNEDPIVKRMQDKFGAEVRSVIDHRKGDKQKSPRNGNV